MKEIDLLPQWYKSNKARQRTLRSQYLVLGGVVVVLFVWNHFLAGSVSVAKAELDGFENEIMLAEAVIEKAELIESQINEMQEKAAILAEVDPHIDVDNVLSEIAYIVSSEIVLSEVTFSAERFDDSVKKQKRTGGIRIAGKKSKANSKLPLGDVRFKGLIKGIATETGEVGKFVRVLEDSDYFHSVSLSFSRNKTIRIGTDDDEFDKQVSEFEISCYLANYELSQKK